MPMEFSDGHRVRLLAGGQELFAAMCEALAHAQREAWLATYIFSDDATSRAVAQALAQAAQRGVVVKVLVDGFGSNLTLGTLRQWWAGTGVQLEVFRPLDRWWAWLQPAQLRRMHHKLMAVDGHTAFIGGINIIDDRFDQAHGWVDQPRLDFAVQLHGSLVAQVQQVAQGLWTRAAWGRDWRGEIVDLARGPQPVARTLQRLRELRTTPAAGPVGSPGRSRLHEAVHLALVVRDNVRQRRAIERTYIEAITRARTRIDLACPYFYPGRAFRRALRRAAERGVRIRLLMQGKIDYRFAALAARVLYDEMLSRGIRVFEYTPAFLHAKVAVVDHNWATVGSSNIDPLSLWLNLEANVVVQHEPFVADLSAQLDHAFGQSLEVSAPSVPAGWRARLMRWLVASVANTYLRLAGMNSRY